MTKMTKMTKMNQTEPLAFYARVELPGGLRIERYPHDDIAGLIYVELSLPARHPMKWWQQKRVSFRITQEQAVEFAQLVLREYTAGRL